MLQVRQSNPISSYLRKGIVSCFIVLCSVAILFSYLLSTAQAGTLGYWPPGSVTDVARGSSHACAIVSGQLYCWGASTGVGELGTGVTIVNEHTPVPVGATGVMASKTVTDISLQSTYSCAVASGEAFCWGSNTNGRLGDNSTTQRSAPVAVNTSGVLSGRTITAIETGNNAHTCAVADGLAFCWGSNINGRLGNGEATTFTSSVPVAVDTSGVLAGKTVTAISAGGTHTCVIADGQVFCWGLNTSGQLGNNSTVESLVPVAVDTSGLLLGKTITDISLGAASSCVVADGEAFCWGSGSFGGGISPSSVPVAVDTSGVLAGKTMTKIDVDSNTCAVASGEAFCWGSNTNGILGNNSVVASSILPVAVDMTGTMFNKTVTDIAAGSCAVASGQAFCWGTNNNGQLGDGSSTFGPNSSTYISRVPVSVAWRIAISGSTYRFFANDDAVQPGSALANTGQVATLTTSGDAFRLRAGITGGVLVSLDKVSVGDSHSCGISSGKAYCWGSNVAGKLGINSNVYSSRNHPIPVDTKTGILEGRTVTAITARSGASCAIADALAFCWGGNGNGQLGINNLNDRFTPVAVTTAAGILLDKSITAIDTNGAHTCAVGNGIAYCWGFNSTGQVGDSSTTRRTTPVAVTAAAGILAGKTVTTISTGAFHTCAIADGLAYCWGTGTNGRLGDSSTTSPRTAPVAVTAATGILSGKTVTAISAGETHTCAIANGAAYCWGLNTNGQLGDSSTSQRTAPVAVTATGVLAGKTVTAISAGNAYTCAVADGAAYCWGLNTNGQLGDSSVTQRTSPVAVSTLGHLGGQTVTGISAGMTATTCADTAMTVHCWGENRYGQVGDNSVRSEIISSPSSAVGVNLADTLIPEENYFKLRFAQKTAASCSMQSTGFADVTTTSAIAWNTNPSATSGAVISSNVDDPVPSGDAAYQTYVSNGSEFANTANIAPQKYGLWDFSLKDHSALPETSYCLKITYKDNTDLEQYLYYPEIQTGSVSMTLDFVDQNGNAVSDPSFAMTSTNLLTSCQLVTGTMGSLGANRMRITQGSPGNGWNVSLAATGGATSSWARVVAGAFYDYNDASGSPAGCNSGSDGDGLAGQLSVAANTITLTPQSGCGMTGLSLGAGMTGFEQGSVDAITLLTSSSSSSPNCFWDLPDMSVQQYIPANQSAGSYEIQLTATVVAQ